MLPAKIIIGKSPAELGLPVKTYENATLADLRSRLDNYAHGRGTPEGAPRDSAADSALRELVSRLEAAKAPVEAKSEVAEGRSQKTDFNQQPTVTTGKAAPVEVAKVRGQNSVLSTQPTVTVEKTAPAEPAPTKSPRKSPTKSPTKSALAKEMEAMGLDFTKPEDYATYRIMKLIEGGKPLPQEKATKKSKAKSETVDKDAEARLAEDLAREESKARKRVEEEKARDEAPEVESDGTEDDYQKSGSHAETPSDSKGKSVGVDRSEEILTPKKPTPKAKKSTPSDSKGKSKAKGEETRGDSESPHIKNPSDSKRKSKAKGGEEKGASEAYFPKPTPKPKKSTPSTPEQAAKEALWKFQAAFPLGKVKSSTSTFLCLPFRLPSRHADALRSAKLAGL